MMKSILLCSALLLSFHVARAADALPRDVQKFIDKREGCDHKRGEIPEPSERRRMDREIRKLCTGTDKDLLQLKKKYAQDRRVMQRLNAFENGIEAAQLPTTRH